MLLLSDCVDQESREEPFEKEAVKDESVTGSGASPSINALKSKSFGCGIPPVTHAVPSA
jgi:hypothetical protein